LPLGIIEIDKEVEIAKSQNSKKKFQVDITTGKKTKQQKTNTNHKHINTTQTIAGGRVYSMTHERENVIDEWIKQLKEAMIS